jgi:WD40 repeat protein
VWNRLRQAGWSANKLNEQLATQSKVAFLRVRSVAARQSPTLLRDLLGHSDVVMACAVTPDGRRVVSASNDRTLKAWDLESGRELATLKDTPTR